MEFQNAVCFTGHRPNKMNIDEKEAKELLEKAIDDSISRGKNVFITGMAMGIDIWAAEVVLKKKAEGEAVFLICALPHPGFEKRRSEEEKKRFFDILEKADTSKLISEKYFTGCYQKRNVWMVDLSSLVIAAYNGEAGGTKNTIDYAKRKGKQIINIL